MDEIKIMSKFAKSTLSKLISIGIRKKFGRAVTIQIEDLNITNADGKIHIHLNTGIDMPQKELAQMLNEWGVV